MPIPYADALGKNDPLKVLRNTPRRLHVLLDRVSEDQLDQPLAEGKWSLREVLAHLADCEIAWAWRLRQVFAEPGITLQPFDQDKWAEGYANYSVAEAWATFKSLRKWNTAFLAGLTEHDREKKYSHPERGEETLWTIAKIAAGHDLHHLDKLEVMFRKEIQRVPMRLVERLRAA